MAASVIPQVGAARRRMGLGATKMKRQPLVPQLGARHLCIDPLHSFIFFVSPSYGPPPTAADQDEVRPDSNPSAKMERASRCKTVTPALPLATKAE